MTYGTRDVARLTGLPPGRVRQLVRDGWVDVGRDSRGALRFDVSAIARLKRADTLVQQVSRGRLRAALAALGGRPDLDRLDVVGGELVVRDGPAVVEARTGQVTLALEARQDAPVETLPPPAPVAMHTDEWDAEDWFHLGCDLDGYDDDRAADAYRRAIGLDPGLVDAKVNLGRLLAVAGDTDDALSLLHEAIEDDPGHPVAWFDLGTVQEDVGDLEAALDSYAAALEADPYMADAHLNAARVCEQLGRQADAIRHLAAYRQLTGS